MASLTPMIRQYLEIKEQYKDAVLLFRLGDFYETFFEDAKRVSDILQIVLTNRNGHPMAGIPYHALDNYLKKLLENGLKVAICEQLENPEDAKGIIKREVTRIITPGTIIEENMLDEINSFSLLIKKNDDRKYIVSIFDFSTGEVYLDSFEFNESELIDFIISSNFVQILLSEELKDLSKKIKEINNKIYIESLDEWYFSKNYKNQLEESYGSIDFNILGFSKDELITFSAVLKYLEVTQFSKVKHFKIPKRLKTLEYMYIDSNTVTNLGLIPSNETKGKTLYDILKKTKTPMGNRLLREYLLRPLIDKNVIENRLNNVEIMYKDRLLMNELKEYLSYIRDIDRISTRISLLKATPSDILALKTSLNAIPYIYELLESSELSNFFEDINLLQNIKEKINNTLFENANNDVGKGFVIKEGVSKELDEYRNLSFDIDKILKEIENKEKEKTGITKLKVGRNKIYGFYVEVSKTQANLVPEYYIRRQTLTNNERFIFEELKDLEKKMIIAEDKIRKIEKKLYLELLEWLNSYTQKIKKLSDKISELDVLRSFAEISVLNNYVRPTFTENKKSKIMQGRHPVVEKFSKEYTSNDFDIDNENFFIILTGPNMSGKSTYLRQVGIISVMAQIGCFVPAKKALLPIYDRIFTRIGARDDIITGKSTFLMEMLEMSTILNNATKNSLVLLDEVGRGTSTLDGISVAWAISEYIFQVIGSISIFATHYTELTMMADIYEGVTTKRVKVLETENGVIFLHKIEDGVSDNSYGIEVAKLAGFPIDIITRSKEVLDLISNKIDLENNLKKMKNVKKKRYKVPKGQIKIF
ncbi:DNA mismatch repair protein MutS [Tepiditoga spiralis]|uniref:DNA mismatch repair protein MutS n=1 Tax=Tepiditoga spiralis TaxID=2108365 RepID=A0A7G1G5J8_9BACT|nr:DNA mismatch repair protein MutS [Tepiditoga spiralis]BBE31860.1 DNA mismatch repair protein MutS [Tepiditoga spiralis]